MQSLIWIGAGLTLMGLAGVIYSIFAVARARKSGLEDEALRQRVSGILPINLGSLFVSTIGLMMVILGIFLT